MNDESIQFTIAFAAVMLALKQGAQERTGVILTPDEIDTLFKGINLVRVHPDELKSGRLRAQ